MEPEKEKNPKQENEELLEQSHQHENDSHEIDDDMGEEKTISFKNRLFTISYRPKDTNDILSTGVKYKPKIRGKVEEYIDRNTQFHIVYKVY